MPQFFRILTLISSAFILSGCVNLPFQKRIKQENLEVDLKWCKEFREPKMQEYVTQVLADNKKLKASYYKLQKTWVATGISGYVAGPIVDTSFRAERKKQSFIGFPIGDGTSSISSSRTNYFQTGLNVSWELDVWGRVKALKNAEKKLLSSEKYTYLSTKMSLAGQAMKSYIFLAESHLQRELAIENLKVFSDTKKRVNELYDKGIKDSAIDARLANIDYNQALSNLSEREINLKNAERAYQILRGNMPNSKRINVRSLPKMPKKLPRDISISIINKRPDLISAKEKLLSLKFRKKESFRAIFPKISLSGSYGTSSSEVENLLKKDFSIWNIGANLVEPIFRSGAIIGGIKIKNLNFKQAIETYENTFLEAASELSNFLDLEKSLKHRQNILSSSLKESKKALKDADNRYENGTLDILTLLSIKKRWIGIKSQILQIKRARLENRVNIHLAMGGSI